MSREAIDWSAVVTQAENQMQDSCATRQERRIAQREKKKIDKKRKKIFRENEDEDIKYQVISQSIPTKDGGQISKDRLGNAIFYYSNLFFVKCLADISMIKVFNKLDREERSRIMKLYPNLFDLEWGIKNIDDKHVVSGGHHTKTMMDFVSYVSKTLSKLMSDEIMFYLAECMPGVAYNYTPMRVILKEREADCPIGVVGTVIPGMWKNGCYAVVLSEEDADKHEAHGCGDQVDSGWRKKCYWFHRDNVTKHMSPHPYESFPTTVNNHDLFTAYRNSGKEEF